MKNLLIAVKEVEQDLAMFAEAVKELRNAAEPFTSGNVVDETEGTEPLMERLEVAIRRIDNFMPHESEVI